MSSTIPLPPREQLYNRYAVINTHFSKVIEHHKEHLTMAKEVVDRAGEGRAYGNLCIRERVLFIGTQFSNLYTAVDTPAMGRVISTYSSQRFQLHQVPHEAPSGTRQQRC
jgi:hypothetical protein